MKDIYDMEELKEELREYVEMEGTEIGEFCSYLLNVAEFPGYMSDDFQVAVAKEIEHQLKMFKDNTEVIEREEIFKHKVNELVWR